MNHKKVVIVAVALIALLAIAGIGAAYAYSASTKNTNNSTTPEYLTIQLKDGNQMAYSESFSKTLLYNTETVYVTDDPQTGHEKYVYTLDESQFNKDVTPSEPAVNDAVAIGGVELVFTKTVNLTGGFTVTMKDAGVQGSILSDKYTYVVGFVYANPSNANENVEKFVSFDPTNGCVLTLGADGSTPFPVDTAKITVTLYVTAMAEQDSDTDADAPEPPLTKVTFSFVANGTPAQS